MKDTDRIAGAEQLTVIFGCWPMFHDAEVLWVRFDRGSDGDGRPTMEALIHTFAITNEVGADGYFVLRHHVLVHFRFTDVVELRLEGFNHQNALMGLKLTDQRDRQLERVQWAVRFDSAFGVDVSFQCDAVEIISVIPCSKAGVPIHV